MMDKRTQDIKTAPRAQKGCTFFHDILCELLGSGHQPLARHFCHRARIGLGELCHADLEKGRGTPAGRALIVRRGQKTTFWARHISRRRSGHTR